MEIYGSAGSIVAARRASEDDPPFEVYRDDRAAGLRGWVTPILRLPRVRQAVGVLDLVAPSARTGARC